MNDEQKLEHKRTQNRLRQKKFYDAHKARLTQGKRDDRAELARLRRQVVEPVVVEPAPVVVAPNLIYNEETVVGLLNGLDINDKTRVKYIRDIKIVFRITDCANLAGCLKTFTKIKKGIEEAKQVADPTKSYAVNSKKAFVQAILYCVDKFNIPLTPPVKQKFVDYFNELKIDSKDITNDRKINPTHAVIPFTEYLAKIEAKFGEDSKQNLIARIYNEVTARDNFSKLIMATTLRKNDDTLNNYLVVPRSKNTPCKIVLNSFKTDSRYKQMSIVLTKYLSKLIRDYIEKHKLTDELFPNSKRGLTSYITIMNKAIGLKGSINLIRHMKVAEFLAKPNLTAEQRRIMAESMAHSPVTQLDYNRLIQ